MSSTYKSVDVLAIGAHPDDVELGCGGTLVRLAAAGHKVGVIDLSLGELGSRGTPEQRAEEAARAGTILGLEFRSNLQLKDGDIPVDSGSRTRLIQILRSCRPKLVLTHHGGGHPDHAKSKQLVEEAVHHSGLSKIETGQPRFRPEKIAFWIVFNQSIQPAVVVDISDQYQIKENALRAFQSQLFSKDSSEPVTYLSDPAFLEQVRAFHRYLGNLIGRPYGEGFRLSRVPRIADLINC